MPTLEHCSLILFPNNYAIFNDNIHMYFDHSVNKLPPTQCPQFYDNCVLHRTSGNAFVIELQIFSVGLFSTMTIASTKYSVHKHIHEQFSRNRDIFFNENFFSFDRSKFGVFQKKNM
jgi:hypothetical protein